MNSNMMDDVASKAEQLHRQAEPYAMALVVRCESPTSAKPGARGLVTRDGTITGWIGGGCAQPIVIEESLTAIKEGSPRLVRITPKSGLAEVNGIRSYEMVCHSGGTMDIFIEPIAPPPQVIILGRSPVARTLARLAITMGYSARVYAQGAAREEFDGVDALEPTLDPSTIARPAQSFVVVSTQGEDDEGGMEAALNLESPYIGFVASPKKWKAVSSYLAERGVSAEKLARVTVPAGVEINAVEPEEIALSIMAQIVATRRSASYLAQAGESASHTAADESIRKAIDPICNMTVQIATAKHTSEFGGQTVYFCCPGCKSTFDKNPEQYALSK